MYWEDKTEETGVGEESEKGGETTKIMRWSVEGCWVAYTNENYTVCSCSHLSTFALIMQIGEVLQICYLLIQVPTSEVRLIIACVCLCLLSLRQRTISWSG